MPGACVGAARSLEAGGSFLRHRVHVSWATHSLEAEGSFLLAEKNESASVTRRLIFFCGLLNCSRLRENVTTPTHALGVQCALGALSRQKKARQARKNFTSPYASIA
ncbi:MAG: hypothetical protein FWF77_07125 [Defluviitaleaceae bacterium]|nr:hypothetical protein [Defluviitaleaceae bacterium]